MTDTSEILKNQYQGNDATTSFDFQFKIFDESELVAIRTDENDVNYTLILDTDFSVTGVGNNTGGSITYPLSGSPLPATQRLTLYPKYALTQTLDFTNQDKAYFELFEEGLDRANLKIKMLQEALERSVKISPTSLNTPDDYLNEASTSASAAASAASAASTANTDAQNAKTAAEAARDIAVGVIPDQTGNAGKYLKTDGSITSWESGAEATTVLLQGQCYLTYTDATTLTLKRENGASLALYNGTAWINSNIPTAGVTLSNASLSANTEYFIYAYDNTGTITLEASTTSFAEDSDSGFQIKSGDPTRLLIGRFRTNASSQFEDNLLASWFNPRKKNIKRWYTADRSTNSTSLVEIDTEIRCEIVTFGRDAISANFTGPIDITASGSVAYELAIGINGLAYDGGNYTSNGSGSIDDGFSCPRNFTPSAGYIYLTALGSTSHASYACIVRGSASEGNRGILEVNFTG